MPNEQKHSDELICTKCGGQYSLKDECEPSEFCDDCVHEVVDELQKELDDVTLKKEMLLSDMVVLKIQKEHWENLATGIAAECSEAKTRVMELENFTNHSESCIEASGQDCTCGLDALLKAK